MHDSSPRRPIEDTWVRARRVRAVTDRVLAAIVVSVALSLGAPASAPARIPALSAATASAPSSAPAELVHYRLTDTWRDAPWHLEAGRFARAADVGADAGGSTYVLDALHEAVHRRSPGGAWSARRLARSETASSRRPERLDVAAGGDDVVLWRGEIDGRRSARLERYRPDGELVAGFETGLDHNDVAIGPDGRLYLTRRVPRIPPSDPDGPRPPGGLDVFDPSGTLLASVEGGDELSLPSGVDVDADGTVYVIDWRPNPEPEPPPDPRPTARPSSRSGEGLLPASGRSAGASWAGDEPGGEPGGDARALGPFRSWSRPEDFGSSAVPAAPSAERAEGIVIFEADLSFRERVDFYGADDIAVGPAGAFVSRQLELFALGDPEAVWTGPAGGISIPYYGAPIHLEVPPRGAPVVASLDHCWFQGVLEIPSLDERPALPAFDGRLDRPALAGPRRPARVDAGAALEDGTAAVRVLLDRWLPETGTGYEPAPAVLHGPWGSQPQSVQRWTSAGRIDGQVGVCGDDQAWFERRSEVRRAHDVALAIPAGVAAGRPAAPVPGAGPGTRSSAEPSRDASPASVTVVVEPELVRAHEDDPARPLPLWTLWAGALDDRSEASDPALRAVDADGGLVAVLDGGAGRVILAPARPVADVVAESRSIGLGRPAAAAVDIALRVDRIGSPPDAGSGHIAIADAGARRVHILDLEGAELTDWPVHDTPRALAFGPEGHLYVLGEGGWMMRYSPAGELVARWPMPRPAEGEAEAESGRPGATIDEVLARDVTVDARGRVLVPFVRRREHGTSTIGEPWWRIEDAGIWVFEPGDRVSADIPPSEACLISTDKSASPPALRRGGLVDVRLEVDGLCPAARRALAIGLVLDVSRSMSWDGALPRAQEAASRLVEALDDRVDRIGLVTFADRPAVVSPLRSDRGGVLRALGAARAGGDTLLGPALSAAGAEILAADPAPDRRERAQVIVLTDGRPSDYPLAEADALRDSGVALSFVVVPRADYQAVFTTVLANLAGGDRDRVVVAPDAEAMRALVGTISEAARPEHLFETLEVIDEVPETMRYVEGSAVPPATWDPVTRTLTWSLGPVERDAPVRLSYRLEPLLDGEWPTNVRASASGRDGTGFDQRLDFPVPRVSVWSPESLVERIYLPFSSALRCLRPAPRDVVLVVDTSQSMDEPTRPGGPRKVDAAAEAAVALVERSAPERDRTAVVTFNARADVLIGLDASPAEVVARLAHLSTAPGTEIDRGLEAAGAVLAGARSDAVRAVLLLSDGRHAGDTVPVLDAARRIDAGGGRIFAVGVGEDADHVLLRAVSESGAFAATADAEGIAGLFAAMDERMRCLPIGAGRSRTAITDEE